MDNAHEGNTHNKEVKTLISFQQPLANASDFSPIRYAATPRFKLFSLSRLDPVDLQQLTFTHSGGSALYQAARVLSVQHNVILVPSYHCPAAIEPFISLGFNCVFYRVKKDLSPDYQHIKQLLSQHQVTHCLTINYFGIISSVCELAALLANRNIAIIHDCAHALFDLLEYAKNPQHADATICSINKILPSIDGGIISLKHKQIAPLTPVNRLIEFKAILYLLRITSIINKVRFAFLNRNSTPIPTKSPKMETYRYFKPSKTEQQCFTHTISIIRHSNLKMIAAQRRSNFQYLSNALRNIPLGTPLINALKGNCVPYVFPFLLNDPRHFDQLRKNGIQCLRWEEVAYSDCDISQDYRSRLLQLPCHHQLSKQALDQMIHILKGPL